jgi:hypothetical protein
MNGGGKLWPDPSGSSDFFGRKGATVHLAVFGRPGEVTIKSASYNEKSLPVEGQDVRFVIVEGPAILSLSLQTNTSNQEVGLLQEIGSGAFAPLTLLILRGNTADLEFKIQGIS